MKFFITPTPLVPLRWKKILELFLPFRQIPQKVYCPIKLHISYSDFSIFFCIFYRILEQSNFYPFVTLNSNIKLMRMGNINTFLRKGSNSNIWKGAIIWKLLIYKKIFKSTLSAAIIALWVPNSKGTFFEDIVF